MEENKNYGDFFVKNNQPEENKTINDDNESITISKVKQIAVILVGWLGLQLFASVIVLIATLIIGDVTSLPENDLVKLDGYINIASYAVITIALLAILGLPVIKKLIKQFTNLEKVGKGFMYGGILLGTSIAYNMIIMLIFPDFGGSNDNQNAVDSLITQMPVLSFFMVVIFAPLVEEITYRLGLTGIFKNKNKIVALIISSVIFGLIHFNFMSEDMKTELIALPSYIISGVVLGLAYLNEDSLATSITAHLTNNLIAFLTTFIPAEAIISRLF